MFLLLPRSPHLNISFREWDLGEGSGLFMDIVDIGTQTRETESSKKQREFFQRIDTKHQQLPPADCLPQHLWDSQGLAGLVLRELSCLGSSEKRTWQTGKLSPKEHFRRFSSQKHPWNSCAYFANSVRSWLVHDIKNPSVSLSQWKPSHSCEADVVV